MCGTLLDLGQETKTILPPNPKGRESREMGADEGTFRTCEQVLISVPMLAILAPFPSSYFPAKPDVL